MSKLEKNTSSHLIQSEGLGDGEAPSLLEGPSDHIGGRGGRRAGQTQRRREPQSAHRHRYVHVVDRAVELGQLGRRVEWNALIEST